MAASNTDEEYYNVYRVSFTQRGEQMDYQALALIPSQAREQTRGKFYHVQGWVERGMVFELRPNYSFGDSKSYKTHEIVMKIKKESLERWENICRSIHPPHDFRVLFETSIDPPVRNCQDWVSECSRKPNRSPCENFNSRNKKHHVKLTWM